MGQTVIVIYWIRPFKELIVKMHNPNSSYEHSKVAIKTGHFLRKNTQRCYSTKALLYTTERKQSVI